MPRLIEEIKLLIVAKEKMVEKNKLEKPKAEKEVIDYAEQKIDLEDKIKKEKEEKKKNELHKSQELVMQKHKSAKIKLESIQKAETLLLETLEELKVELRKAQEGLENYGKKRKEGIAMLDREGKKLKVHCEEARRASLEAESAGLEAEKAAKEGKENDAQGARNTANNALMATITATKNARELIELIKNTMMNTQRNLKAETFGIADKEIVIYKPLIKQLQNDYKALEMMAYGCDTYVKNAEDAAAVATDFANATSVGIDLYRGFLEKALKTGVEEVKAIQTPMTITWGKHITSRGKAFTEELKKLNEKPTDLNIHSVAVKTVELAETYLATTFNTVDGKIQALVDGLKKTIKRVPEEYRETLKGYIEKLDMIDKQMLLFKEKLHDDYKATEIEFEKLADAL